MLKNRGDAEAYDNYSSKALAPWDSLFLVRIRGILRRQPRPASLLDIGTGTGVIPIRLAEDLDMGQVRIVATDTDLSMLDQGRLRAAQAGVGERVVFEPADAQRLPFDSASFNVAVSRATLHHLPEKAESLREMYRVLTAGGVALVHDMRRDVTPAAFARFSQARALAGYPPTILEEKLTPDEAWTIVDDAGLAGVSQLSTPTFGDSALGYEILITKPAAQVQDARA